MGDVLSVRLTLPQCGRDILVVFGWPEEGSPVGPLRLCTFMWMRIVRLHILNPIGVEGTSAIVCVWNWGQTSCLSLSLLCG